MMEKDTSTTTLWTHGTTKPWPVLTLGLLTIAGCGRDSPEPLAIRLVDLFQQEWVTGSLSTSAPIPPRTEWRFEEPGPAGENAKATRGWEAGPGVAGLAVRSGRLSGRTTSGFPILHVERTSGLEEHDQLHAIEVRMRVSAGTNLSIGTASTEKIDLARVEEIARAFPWDMTSPLLPGEEMRTYVLTKPRPLLTSRIRHLLIRPADVAGARFEIESVRVISRREHLAGIPSGIGWQGMSEAYRESVVSRAPETIRFPVQLPSRPFLDLAIGSMDPLPVTFRVGLSRSREPSAAGTALLERTLTTPYRWESVPIDLADFAGESVTLRFSLESQPAGSLGIWGSPVIRQKGTPPAATADSAPQGVILLWVDTLRRDHLDVYGYERSTGPVVAQLAKEGVLFQNCLAQATWTKVSTPSVLTSLYPSSHGVINFSDYLPASAVTLAELYREAGYATVSFASNLFTGRFTNLHQGFEELHEDGSLANPESSKSTREYVDRILAWLELHREVPFFAFVHLYDPHDPYEPREPYDRLWADPSRREEHLRQSEEVRKFIRDPLGKLFGMPSREELLRAGMDAEAYVAHDRDWYDGSIRGMDTELGRLMERLKEWGLDEKTLIAFAADHGEEFIEHGRMFHGQGVYGELTNVPLILRWPEGLPSGALIEETVQTIDIMPTLLALSGLSVPETAQGQSLVPLMRPAQAEASDGSSRWQRRPAVSEKNLTREGAAAPWPRDTESYAILEGDWKLIHNRTRKEGTPEYELYRVKEDPLEQHNRAAENPEVVSRLAKHLEQWHRMALSNRLKPDSQASEGLTQEQLQRLRSLGYIR